MKGSDLIVLIDGYNLEDFDFGVTLTDTEAEIKYDTLFDEAELHIDFVNKTVYLSAEHSE